MLETRESTQSAKVAMHHAVEDAAPDLDRCRAACLHLNRLAPGTKAFSFERSHLQEVALEACQAHETTILAHT